MMVELSSKQQVATAVFTSKMASMTLYKVADSLSKGKHTCILGVAEGPPQPLQQTAAEAVAKQISEQTVAEAVVQALYQK